jgi:Glycosyl hydrolase family 20, catalytic domain
MRVTYSTFFGSARVILLWMALAVVGQAGSWTDEWRTANPVWRGVHVLARSAKEAHQLETVIPALATNGMNVLILEVDFNFAFSSHPEMREGSVITGEDALRLTTLCHRHGVRLIPQFNCLGHQSWAQQTFPLLRLHPEFDETPDKYPKNEGIYCRSWCPQHPRVNALAFSLMDEIVDAFQADAIHIGMDEVFLIASPDCRWCRGKDPARLFAKSINDLHRHLVGDRHLELLIWADRLLDSRTMGYGEWESATNGTAGALSQIPKDVILCDWHYETLDKYEGRPKKYGSIDELTQHGFRVWPTGWKTVAAVDALNREGLAHRTNGVLGYLCSTWGAVKLSELPAWPPLVEGFRPWR